jgi:hypothetical protein
VEEELMTLAEKIFTHLQALPEGDQAEVLDFVEFLQNKSKRRKAEDEERTEWSAFSLAQALRGMEDEPGYSEDDLKERF